MESSSISLDSMAPLVPRESKLWRDPAVGWREPQLRIWTLQFMLTLTVGNLPSLMMSSVNVNCLNHMKHTVNNSTDGIQGQCNCSAFAYLKFSNQRLAFQRRQT